MSNYRWAALAFFALGAACVVPSLDSLGPGACDATHACVDGYVCVAGLCQHTGADAGCVEGEVCGSNIGECQTGTQHCNTDGTLADCAGSIGPRPEICDGKDNDCDGLIDNGPDGGALYDLSHPCALTQGVCEGSHPICTDGGFEATCTALSYGSSYQVSETQCDGLDNDCNGSVDLLADGGALVNGQACELQAGVCLGATRACADGGWETPCGPASYGPNFQAFETKCDGLDNDCDGLTDQWNRVQVSPSSGSASQAVAVEIPGVPFGVLVLWQQGTGVVSRTLNPDGTLGPVQVPSISIPSTVSSRNPKVATDGTTIAAAWVEKLDAGNERLMTATLGATGVSSVTGGGAYLVSTLEQPEDLDVSIGGGNVEVAIQGDFSAGGNVEVTWVPLPLSPPPTQGPNILIGGAAVGRAPANGARVTYATASGVMPVMVWWNEPSTSSVAGEAISMPNTMIRTPLGPLSNAANAAVTRDPSFWSAVDGGTYVQQLSCSSVMCNTLTSWGPLPAAAVEVAPVVGNRAFAWEFTSGGSPGIRIYAVDGGTILRVTDAGHFPVLVAPGPSANNVTVVYQAGPTDAGVVWAQPFCVP